METLRRFTLAAWLSYRALFTWLNRWGYISTRIVAPTALTLLFGAIGRSTGNGAARPVVGGAILTAALSALLGINLVMANERTFGTLAIRAVAPEGLLLTVVGKAVPQVLDGLLNAAITLTVCAVVLQVPIPPSSIPALAAATLAAAVSASGLGLVAAAYAVYSRDVFTAANVCDVVLTLLSGAFIPVESLPRHLGVLAPVIPGHAAINMADTAVSGGAWSPLGLVPELLLTLLWGGIGWAVLHAMMSAARRDGTFDLR